MKMELLRWLRCPTCRTGLTLQNPQYAEGEVKEGKLVCSRGCVYPISTFIPRFVSSDRYTRSFSFEWNKHRLTQYDSYNRDHVSEDTLRKFFASDLRRLRGRLVLDAGCGSGRYAEIAAKYRAIVIGTDLSYSVDFAREQLKKHRKVHLIQADIFKLPFAEETFDIIYSLGVLHHTPDAKKAFYHLPPLLKRGGKLVMFVYASYNKPLVYSSAFWRFFTTRIPKPLLYYASFLAIPLYYIYRIPVLGHLLKCIFIISMDKNPRVRVLDTFDWYSPKFQSKHTPSEVFQWFRDAGLDIVAIPTDHVSFVGMRR